jgi:hypothetical protein
MTFKLYEKTAPMNGNYATEPRISLSKNGDLRINYVAACKFNIPDIAFVELHYDDETGRIGLKLLREPSKHSYKLRSCDTQYPIRSAKRLSIRRFATDVNLSGFGDKPIQWDAAWDDATQMIVLTRAEQ